MKDLLNKVVVITGASSGTGRAIANEFASKGAILVLAGRREPALNAVKIECQAAGGIPYVLVADVRKATDVANLARFASEITGAIDIWINNAGVLAAGMLEEIPDEVNTNVILTNLVGYVNGAHEVVPYFKKQGYGMLFNNISVGGWFPSPYAAAYTASKFGIRGFSDALKGELAEFPEIHVIDLFPGFLDTPGIQHAANYTGKVIQPAPPVYDPRKVARAIIRLTENPTPVKTIGAASAFLRLSYGLFPKLTRAITATVIRKYLNQAQKIAHTSGNVLSPVEFGTSIHGGWSRKFQPGKKTVGVAAIAAIGAFILLGSIGSAKK